MKHWFFQVKRGERFGDRLVLRNPATNSELVAALRAAGVPVVPSSGIAVGYYRQLTEPNGAWCFMPVNTPSARALLRLPAVQRRISEDLISRIFPN